MSERRVHAMLRTENQFGTEIGKRQTILYPKSLFKDPPQSTGRLRELAWRS